MALFGLIESRLACWCSWQWGTGCGEWTNVKVEQELFAVKVNRLRKWRINTWMCWLILVSVMAGCSGDSVKTAEVTGKVTRKGKPLEGVSVRFLPDPVKGTTGPSSRGITDVNGAYSAIIGAGSDARPGAVIGYHRVVLEDFMAENSRGKVRQRVPLSLASSSTSKIDIEVRDSEEPQSFDFEVTDY